MPTPGQGGRQQPLILRPHTYTLDPGPRSQIQPPRVQPPKNTLPGPHLAIGRHLTILLSGGKTKTAAISGTRIAHGYMGWATTWIFIGLLAGLSPERTLSLGDSVLTQTSKAVVGQPSHLCELSVKCRHTTQYWLAWTRLNLELILPWTGNV